MSERESPLKELVNGARRRLSSARRYYKSPAKYWDRRYEHSGDSLDGSGRMGLGDAANTRDYDEKWVHVGPLVASLAGSQSSLLDAGCGSGWFTKRFVEAGYDVTAVDFSEGAIRQARGDVGEDVDWNVAPLYDFSPGRRFDVVVCVDVLFHVVDDALWERAIKNLARLVGDDGHLVIQDQLVEQANDADGGGATHVRWRTLGAYERALSGTRLMHHEVYRLPESGDEKHLVAFSGSVTA